MKAENLRNDPWIVEKRMKESSYEKTYLTKVAQHPQKSYIGCNQI